MPDDKVAAVRAPETDAVGNASRACAVATYADASAMSCTEISVFNIRRFTIRVLGVVSVDVKKYWRICAAVAACDGIITETFHLHAAKQLVLLLMRSDAAKPWQLGYNQVVNFPTGESHVPENRKRF